MEMTHRAFPIVWIQPIHRGTTVGTDIALHSRFVEPETPGDFLVLGWIARGGEGEVAHREIHSK